MIFRLIAFCVAAVLASQTSAQLCYLPIEIPLPPSVNRDGLGASFAVGDREIYVYDLETGAITSILEPVNSNPGDRFGARISLENGIAVVGAPGDGEASGFLGRESGAVYIFGIVADELIDKATIANKPDDYFAFGIEVEIQDGVVLASTFDEDSPLFLDYRSVFCSVSSAAKTSTLTVRLTSSISVHESSLRSTGTATVASTSSISLGSSRLSTSRVPDQSPLSTA